MMIETASHIFSGVRQFSSLKENRTIGSQATSTQQSTTTLARWNFSSLRLLLFTSLLASVRGVVFPPKIPLGTLDGTIGFALDGVNMNDRSGASLFNAGDLNGDGIADMVIGAPDAGVRPLLQSAGEVYVVFGKKRLQTPSVSQLASLDGTNGFVIRGELPLDGSGTSIYGGCDLNNDTFDDLIIGAKGSSSQPGQFMAGRAYVIFGGPNIGAAGSLNLGSLNGTTGLRLVGEHLIDQTGHSVSCGRDINGDGIDDFAIGAFGASPSPTRQRAGKTYVVFGNQNLGMNRNATLSLSTLSTTDGFVVNGEHAHDNSGNAISFVGDMNGDAIGDLIIAAIAGDPAPNRMGAGRAYLMFGHTKIGSSGVEELSEIGKGTGIIFHGEVGNDFAGSSVAGPGDVNNDGITDLIIGAHWADAGPNRQESGRTYVIFGQAGLDSESPIELSRLHSNQTLGFVINGEQAMDLSGTSVSGAGDFNGDGIPDFLIGGNLAQSGTVSGQAGKAYVIFGSRSLGTERPFELSTLNGKNGIIVQGEQNQGHAGWAVVGGGDLNGDGISDIAISAPSFSPSFQSILAGRTYVIFGRNTTTTPPVITSAFISSAAKVTLSTHLNSQLTQSTSTTSKSASFSSTEKTVMSVSPQSIFLSTWSVASDSSPTGDSLSPGFIVAIIAAGLGLCSAAGTIYVCYKKKTQREKQYRSLAAQGGRSADSSESHSPSQSPRGENQENGIPRDEAFQDEVIRVNQADEESSDMELAVSDRSKATPASSLSSDTPRKKDRVDRFRRKK